MRTSLVKIFSIVKSIVIDFHSLSMQFWSSVVFVGPHLYSVEASLTKQTSFIISRALAHWGLDELFMRTNLATQTRTKKIAFESTSVREEHLKSFAVIVLYCKGKSYEFNSYQTQNIPRLPYKRVNGNQLPITYKFLMFSCLLRKLSGPWTAPQ